MSTVEALQAAIAGEHAAVYVDGVLGARAHGALVGRLRAAYDAHVVARDGLAARLHELGAVPAGPAAAYAIAAGLHSDAALSAQARTVEERLVALYVRQAPAATGADRRLLVTAAEACAVRALGFGAAAAVLPGLRA